MDIAELDACPDTDAVMRVLDEHDLVKHALQLDACGVTVIPPHRRGPVRVCVAPTLRGSHTAS